MNQYSTNAFRLTTNRSKHTSALRFALIALTVHLLAACGGSSKDEPPIEVANRAPVATDDSFDVAAGANFFADVLGNDSDPDNDTLTITTFTQPEHGVLTLDGNELRYQPELTYKGSDEFSYTLTDGEYEATASVTINVTFEELDPTPAQAIAGRLAQPAFAQIMSTYPKVTLSPRGTSLPQAIRWR